MGGRSCTSAARMERSEGSIPTRPRKGGERTAMTTIYPKLTKEMERTGITAKALSNALHLSIRSINNKMTGRTAITLAEAIAVRDLVLPGVSVEWLFRRE